MKKVILITLITAATGIVSTGVLSSSRQKENVKASSFDLKIASNVKRDVGSAD